MFVALDDDFTWSRRAFSHHDLDTSLLREAPIRLFPRISHLIVVVSELFDPLCFELAELVLLFQNAVVLIEVGDVKSGVQVGQLRLHALILYGRLSHLALIDDLLSVLGLQVYLGV